MREGEFPPRTTPTPFIRQSPNIAHVITSTVSPHVPHMVKVAPEVTFPHIAKVTTQFLSRDIDIANLSVRPSSVRLSVRYVPVSDENGLTYRHSFFTIR